MANPTTSFGWVMPTSSSLVTNLPADFNTFGQAVDTSMQYLLGGTTGQVLSKTSATNMAFTWITPTDQTPLTTKGDLFTFTTVDARLAVGNNGEQLLADSAATTGLRYSATPSASNPVLNSAFQVFQRGTTTTLTSTSFVADRWQAIRSVAGATGSQQVTGDTTNLPNIQYCLRVARNSANTSTTVIALGQNIESVNSIPFAGKSITYSFYARAGANFSQASGALNVYLTSGTGTDQNNVTGSFTGATQVVNSTATLTTTWQRFSFTGTVAATATQLGPQWQFTPVGTAGANDYFEITGVQIDIGSVALPFRTYAATIQGELAACQRYYYRFVPFAGSGGNYYGPYAVGGATSTTNAYVTGHIPVGMRSAPTFNRSGSQIYNSASNIAVTALSNAWATGTSFSINVTVASGLTAGQVCHFAANNNSADYFDLSAEL